MWRFFLLKQHVNILASAIYDVITTLKSTLDKVMWLGADPGDRVV
jgi:hypothetical protein